jgi:hypothetical protein
VQTKRAELRINLAGLFWYKVLIPLGTRAAKLTAMKREPGKMKKVVAQEKSCASVRAHYEPVNSSLKIKPGYEFVLDEAVEPVEDFAPSFMFNVPNPASDVAEDVTIEEVRAAIQASSKASLEQGRHIKPA